MSNSMVCIVTCSCTLVAAVLTVALSSLVKWFCHRRRMSRISKVILNAYENELKVGVGCLNQNMAGGMVQLPTEAWNTYVVSEDLVDYVASKVNGLRCSNGFLPTEFFIHVKNYYCYICGNVNAAVVRNAQLPIGDLQKYLSATNGLISTISAIKDSL